MTDWFRTMGYHFEHLNSFRILFGSSTCSFHLMIARLSIMDVSERWNNVFFDTAFIFTAQYFKVTGVSPPHTPAVGSNLKYRKVMNGENEKLVLTYPIFSFLVAKAFFTPTDQANWMETFRPIITMPWATINSRAISEKVWINPHRCCL